MVSCCVLVLFDKHYNKLFLSGSFQKKWHANFLKIKFRVIAMMIQYDEKFREHKDVDPMNVGGSGVNEVYLWKMRRIFVGSKEI